MEQDQKEQQKLIEPRRRWSIGHLWEYFTGEPLKRWEKIVGAIALIIFLIVFYIVLDANKYEATVHVIAGEGKVGINPTTERLDFGDLSPGTSAVRRVDIENRTPIPMYVAIIRFGSITDLMKLDKNFFVVGARGGEKVEFTVYMPASATIDSTMDGRVYLFKIPGPWR